MNSTWHRRRFISLAMAAGVVAGGFVALDAAPAVAYTQVGVGATTWAYTDARQPLQTHVNEAVDAPVGVWRDSAGRTHLSRSYFTFDISSFAGATVPAAEIVTSEKSANDCTAEPAVELRRTAGFTAPTWRRPPAESGLVDGTPSTEGCPSWRDAWDVRDTLVAALAAGRSTVTLELRVPQRLEANPRYGRTFDHAVKLIVQYNRAPRVPTGLSVDSQLCGSAPYYLGSPQPGLSAADSDPDGDSGSSDEMVSVTFAIAPVSDPTRRTELSTIPGPPRTNASVTVPDGVFSDGQTYQITARAVDDDAAVSGWSEPCTVVADFVPPANPPLVSSVQYPPGFVLPGSGGPGIPGQFTFSANGETDIVGYLWGELSPTEFAGADALGGSATITWTPQSSGPKRMFVVSVDRAGHRSPQVIYQFLVKSASA
ncbi:hypothetical protein [Dactylosporangium sp. NPDC049140]|uniref:hypothetical protein n=1 Tax=Dactylosporangium sp. NPDC049140 TaxID=3155647 RepID=UPI0033C42E29